MGRPIVVLGFAALVGYAVYTREQKERAAVVDAYNTAAATDAEAKADALRVDMELRSLVHQDVFFSVALALAVGGFFMAAAG